MSDRTETIEGEPTRRRTGHEEAWDLLPWFVNGTLETGDVRAVEEHVQGCGICREELRFWRSFAGFLQEEGELAVSAHAGLERLQHRIAAAGPAPAVDGRGGESPAGARSWLTGLRLAPVGVRWALAAQLAVILGLAGLVAAPYLEQGPVPAPVSVAAPAAAGEPRPAGPFRTLADEPPPAATAGTALLRVVFTDRSREREIRGALIAVGGQIVDGPSPAGVYTVAVDGSGEGAAALDTLRSLPQVRFAERAVQSLQAP
jgi:hypothetical protein